MPIIEDPDRLVWRFRVTGDEAELCECPGEALDPPQDWVAAVVAVARDLRCWRFGREIDPQRLLWELSVGGEYSMRVGWSTGAGVGGFAVGHGLPLDASRCAAAVWVADVVQAELAGYEFVQWPSRGRHLLSPRQIDDSAVWIDPHTDAVVAQIGDLCATATHW
ncbi:hypothetical protein IU487_34730 [Nocardia puris]|uniref:hypothetical protein n=1 Tax=Nocardia puris TaxID=208602 RepID=UPI0018938C0B|nr:hypothetical protein [Nocardia puris]MBF6216152.1 hypothetical protein [Nocardia puris]